MVLKMLLIQIVDFSLVRKPGGVLQIKLNQKAPGIRSFRKLII